MTITSAGKYKTELSATGPLSDEARAYGQSQIDTYYKSFLDGVARGRRTTAARVRTQMGEGRTLLPDAANAANMIDGVATLAQVIGKLQARLQRGGNSATSSTPRLAAMQRETLLAELESEL